MSGVVHHKHFGSGHKIQKSKDGELTLVIWDIKRKTWVRHGWYDLSHDDFSVGDRRPVSDGRRILSALRRQTTSK